MDTYYTSERNAQILISLMKAHHVKKVIASPGATNVFLVASLQQDPYFEIYSSVDERSAAYMACGMAAETGEPVALSCTGATASRNYIPGLTEAFYRKLPILAITASQQFGRVGQYTPQFVDRSVIQKDIALLSVQIPTVHSKDDEWACEIALNRALLELKHRGGGPVHINIATTFSSDFSVKELPACRVINRITHDDAFPELSGKKIGIFVGAHCKWSESLTNYVNKFCSIYNAVVLCDHTSNYKGKYRTFPSIVCSQEQYDSNLRYFDIIIHIGEVSGAYLSIKMNEVWRVSPDGEIRDLFHKLRYVFEMTEEEFFSHYCSVGDSGEEHEEFLTEWKREQEEIYSLIPDNIPFSNAWIAQQTAYKIPANSVLHLGILNSLRNWNFFDVPESVLGFSNTGGFGIDGGVSSLIGAAIGSPDKLFYGVVGDLAFFYDMNSIGNRSVGNNIRLLVINNGRGQEFRNYNHKAALFGEDTDKFIAAAGHYGNQSPDLIRHYAQDLGFTYLCAGNKEEYLSNLNLFLDEKIPEKPILFEIFTDTTDESNALEIMNNLVTTTSGSAKKFVKNMIGKKGVSTLKKFVGGGVLSHKDNAYSILSAVQPIGRAA